jgi:hypothetical protein
MKMINNQTELKIDYDVVKRQYINMTPSEEVLRTFTKQQLIQ